jgi:hypothetical protein
MERQKAVEKKTAPASRSEGLIASSMADGKMLLVATSW